jgi:hypothetical protein
MRDGVRNHRARRARPPPARRGDGVRSFGILGFAPQRGSNERSRRGASSRELENPQHLKTAPLSSIPFLLLEALYEDERRDPLWIAGPPGIEQRVRTLASALGYALEEREWSFPIRFEELRPGAERQIGPVGVDAFEVFHQPQTAPHGLAVRFGPQRLVYSGDTGFFPDLPDRVGDADLFVCECTYLDNDFEYHISHKNLVARKHEFRCQRIILTHLGQEMLAHRGNAAFGTADDGLRVRL